ncbi:hypothetical protein BX600DRAFT_506606 [Xylariales sp. PMI_506]|nr:hypothetical protein BX600DRAFT_506606 [Xylariales sp. PMI_506]
MLSKRVSARAAPLLSRYGIVLVAIVLMILVFTQTWDKTHGNHTKRPGKSQTNRTKNGSKGSNTNALYTQPQADPPKSKVYKPAPAAYNPISDPFPWLTKHRTQPPVTFSNQPPYPHIDEETPLIIGFTRNWPMLLQSVASYIAAGWPAEDIWVVENTGTFTANKEGKLSLQNPFFMNHTQLDILGVHVITTPTLLSFSQLQNYYLNLALQQDWSTFFWSHQDVLVFSDEEIVKKDRDHDYDYDPFASLYERAVGLLRYLEEPDMPPWATHFFAYDLFTLVNRDAYLKVGGWDTQIPFHTADCDMYLRLHWAGYWQPQSEAGLVYEVADHLDDVGALFRLPGSHASFANDPVFVDPDRPFHEVEQEREQEMRSWVNKEGESFQHLVQVAERMVEVKEADTSAERNTWQMRQRGGAGEPFYRDPQGFEDGMQSLIAAGRNVFADKWGHRGCNLLEMGIEASDAWRLQRDWDVRKEGLGNENGEWDKDWTGFEETQ